MTSGPAAPAASRRRTHHGTFGNDRFGVLAERFARGFGTPHFIIGQSVVVAAWIAVNAVAFGLHWDPYPFILLNLGFSTQAAYAAPLILLAQTRQAERDKLRDAAVEDHRDVQARHEEDFESQLRATLDEIARTLHVLESRGRPHPAAGRDDRTGP
jgi:uncharacterized membrane protein